MAIESAFWQGCVRDCLFEGRSDGVIAVCLVIGFFLEREGFVNVCEKWEGSGCEVSLVFGCS